MALTGPDKAAYNRKRYLEKKEEAERAEKTAKQRDAYKKVDTLGKRYKSEVRDNVELYDIYNRFCVNEDGSGKRVHFDKKVLDQFGDDQGEELTFESWLEYRDKARKDLFWLGTRAIKHVWYEKPHLMYCQQFVSKNFDDCYPVGYTLDHVHKAIEKQERFDADGRATREMLLLAPRGSYKSYISGCDTVQWLLNCPDMRILILTGEYKLAVAFMSQIKSYFYQPDESPLTEFQILFPEYLLSGTDGTSEKPFVCPARRQSHQKEPSVWVNAIGANLSGWHCDRISLDDAVTDENSNTHDTRGKLKDKLDNALNLLDEWGVLDIVGTRYNEEDFYGLRIAASEESPEEAPLKYFCIASWEVKPEFQNVKIQDLEESMVDLLFPEKLTWKSLRKKMRKNLPIFLCQQMNKPLSDEDTGMRVNFRMDDLQLHMIADGNVPTEGPIVIAWDWASSTGKTSDFSAGVVARVVSKVPTKILDGQVIMDVPPRLYILEVAYGRWPLSELTKRIVELNKKWNPNHVLIEKSPGSEILATEIMRMERKLQIQSSIQWKQPSSKLDSKRNRIASLEPLLKQDRLYFVMGPWLEETFSQMIRYTGERKNRGRKDDIPDAMSYLSVFIPGYVPEDEDAKIWAEQARQRQMERAFQELYFGPSPLPPIEEAQPIARMPDPRFERANKIFGGNGLRCW